MSTTDIIGRAEFVQKHPQLQGHFQGAIPSYMHSYTTSVGGEILTHNVADSTVSVGVTADTENVIFFSPLATYPAGEEMDYSSTARVVTRAVNGLLRFGSFSTDLQDALFYELTGTDAAPDDRLVFRSGTLSQSDMEALAGRVGGSYRANPEGLTGCTELVVPRSEWSQFSGLDKIDFSLGAAGLHRVLWYGIIGVRAEQLGYGQSGGVARDLSMRQTPGPYWTTPNHHLAWQAIGVGAMTGTAEMKGICFNFSTPQEPPPAHRHKSIRIRKTGLSVAAGSELPIFSVRLKPGICRPFRSYSVSCYFTANQTPLAILKTYRNVSAANLTGATWAGSQSDSTIEYDTVASAVAAPGGDAGLGITYTPDYISGAFTEQTTTTVVNTNEESFGCLINGTTSPDRETLTFSIEAITGTIQTVDIKVEFEEF